MTRKDYRLIAQVIRGLGLHPFNRSHVCDRFAEALCQHGNFTPLGTPRFDPAKFRDACLNPPKEGA